MVENLNIAGEARRVVPVRVQQLDGAERGGAQWGNAALPSGEAHQFGSRLVGLVERGDEAAESGLGQLDPVGPGQEIVGVVDRGGQYEPRQALAGERGGVAKGLLLFRRQAEVEATSQSLGHVRNVDVLRRRLIGVDAARSVSPWRPNEVLLFPTFAHRHSERVRLVGVTQFRGLGAQSD